MPAKLPNEVLLNVLLLVGDYSTLDMKPLALLNRYWHRIISPKLLSTIAISSLSGLMELCSHLISSGKHKDRTPQSNIAKYAKTIVVNGTVWESWKSDCPVGIDGLGVVSPAYILDGNPTLPDADMPPEQIFSIIRDALPRLISLESFEWYGRFAGDYYLVQYLRKAHVVRRLAYGIDKNVSSLSNGKLGFSSIIARN